MDPDLIAIEYKPWLRICEFFLQSKWAIKSLNIYVNDGFVKVQVNGSEKLVLNMTEWNIINGSTSSIHVSQNNGLNFKVRTKCTEDDQCDLSEFFPFISNYKLQPNALKLPFEEGEEVTFYCRGCSKKVNEEPIIFNKIVKDKSSLDIVQDACCAGPSYVHFHYSLIPGAYKNSVIRCHFCRRWLGCVDKSLAYFWYTSVSTNAIVSSDENLALNEFISTTRFLVHKTNFDSDKIILSCQLDDDLKCHILIRIMEKSMVLLKPEESSEQEVFLKDEQVLKLVYSLEESESLTLKKWRESYRAEECLISVQMWKSGLKYLQEMSSIVPNDFKISSQSLVSYMKNE